MKACAALLVLATLAACPGRAEDVRVEVRAIAVPMTEARRLVPALRKPATFATAEARVPALLASGEAELVDWVRAEGGFGQKFVAESLEEVRYPSEFSFGGCFPATFTPFVQSIMDEREGLTTRERARRERYRRANGVNFIEEGYCANPTTPTAFETRNTGSSLQAEAQHSPDAKRIELSLEWVLVHVEQFDAKMAFNTKLDERVVLPLAQPRFSEIRLQALAGC